MDASFVSTPTVDRFDRELARQLAARIARGSRCDDAVGQSCYAEARRQLELAPSDRLGKRFQEIERYFVENVVAVVGDHQSYLFQMPECVTAALLTILLLDHSW